MPEESPSIFARLRAGLASALGGLGRGAHRLEEWSSRRTRVALFGLVAVAVLAVGVFAVMHETRAFAGWMHGGPHAQRFERGPGSWQKPEGERQGGPGGFVGKPAGRPEGKPHIPPQPPAPPAPPAPPTQP